ncbi:MAG: hypothetical protein GY928_02625 [Colwellia sp.]|nr:hypothetical protein [Colwellia sp.]
MIINHLNKARNELILAYNTAKNDERKGTCIGVALALADVSAQQQFCEYLQKCKQEKDDV